MLVVLDRCGVVFAGVPLSLALGLALRVVARSCCAHRCFMRKISNMLAH